MPTSSRRPIVAVLCAMSALALIAGCDAEEASVGEPTPAGNVRSSESDVGDFDDFVTVVRSGYEGADPVVYQSLEAVVDNSGLVVKAELLDVTEGRSIYYTAADDGSEEAGQRLLAYETWWLHVAVEDVVKPQGEVAVGDRLTVEFIRPSSMSFARYSETAPKGVALLLGLVPAADLGAFTAEVSADPMSSLYNALPQAFILRHPDSGVPVPGSPADYFGARTDEQTVETLGRSFDDLVERVRAASRGK